MNDLLVTTIGFSGLMLVIGMIVGIWRLGAIQQMIEEETDEQPDDRRDEWRFSTDDFD